MTENIEFNDSDSRDQHELLNYLGLEGGYENSIADTDEVEAEDEELPNIFSDNSLDDIDFSNYSGSFKKSFRKVKQRSRPQQSRSEIKKVSAPANRQVIVQGEKRLALPRKAKQVQSRTEPISKRPTVSKRPTKSVGVKQSVDLRGSRPKKISKIQVPRDKEVIVKGVNEFILSDNEEGNFIKSFRKCGSVKTTW